MSDYVQEIKDLLDGATYNEDEERILAILREIPKGSEFDSLILSLNKETLNGVSLLRKCFSDINNDPLGGRQYDEFLTIISSKLSSNDARRLVIYILLDISTYNDEEEAIITILKKTPEAEFDSLFRTLNQATIDSKTILEKCFTDINGDQYYDFIKAVSSKIQANDNRKVLMGKILSEDNEHEEEQAIIRLLRSAPCDCSEHQYTRHPDEYSGDRHWVIDSIGEHDIEKTLDNDDTIVNFICAVWPRVNVLKLREQCRLLPISGKYVIFSDLHMCSLPWQEDRYDYFYYNRELYTDALNHYLEKEYTLIENGDIEDYWGYLSVAENMMETITKNSLDCKWLEEWWQNTIEDYKGHYILRNQFHQKRRYVRIRGNHDNLWHSEDLLNKYLRSELPDLEVYETALIGDKYMILHGHQVDKSNRDSTFGIGYNYAYLGITAESVDFLGNNIDTGFFGKKKPEEGWKGNPPNQNHLYSYTIYGGDITGMTANSEKYADLSEKLFGKGMSVVAGHVHGPKFQPNGSNTYNTGCGVYEGVIYGVEIVEGYPSVIKWYERNGESHREVLASLNLKEFESVSSVEKDTPQPSKFIEPSKRQRNLMRRKPVKRKERRIRQ